MTIHVDLGSGGYNIIIERGALQKASQFFKLNRKVLIVTDDGVPTQYAETVLPQCAEGAVVTVKSGEASKSISVYEALLKRMLHEGFTRKDCVVAVGGGVVGDLAGFTAASYMRGIDFYNIPTTVLSQVDSSVGGKTALNLCGVKNVIGAFYQPKCVLIDPDLLKTLPRRQISNGLAEALKMSLTNDADLFSVFEKEDPYSALDTIIQKSVMIKKSVVEQDEKEKDLRRVLNFGHTIGHAIESEEELHGLYHGECVALGMVPMCAPEVRERLVAVLQKLNLPYQLHFDVQKAMQALLHDKKLASESIRAIRVSAPGEYCFTSIHPEDFIPLLQMIHRG